MTNSTSQFLVLKDTGSLTCTSIRCKQYDSWWERETINYSESNSKNYEKMHNFVTFINKNWQQT